MGKLTVSKIKKDNKRYREMEKVEFSNGDYLHINKYFNPTTIDKMLVEFSNTVNELEKIGTKFNDKKIMDFLMLHIIKHFSTLGKEVPDEIESKLEVFEFLLDNEYAQQLAESFNREEIAKVFEAMYKKLDTALKLVEENKKIKQKVKDEIEKKNLTNKDLIMDLSFNEAEEVRP